LYIILEEHLSNYNQDFTQNRIISISTLDDCTKNMINLYERCLFGEKGESRLRDAKDDHDYGI